MNKASKSQYWFKRKRYGYGWTPSTWQGWLVTGAFLFVIIGSAAILIAVYEGVYFNQLVWVYLNIVLAMIAGLIMVSLKKGPAPKWRWGKRNNDNDHEDF